MFSWDEKKAVGFCCLLYVVDIVLRGVFLVIKLVKVEYLLSRDWNSLCT